ncbi:MAG: NAD(P)-binding domain-containing protein, partial [Acetobacteraceae bacterium]|nr:NAD(P)-binding domain-containing protein [Acetobacteraceae bacterium]
MKLAIIGAGAVGQACLLATVLRGPASEIVVVDRTRERADGMVTDIQYGAALSPSVTLRAGDYGEVGDAGLVMVTAGVNEKAGGATDRSDPEGRLKL